MFFKLKHNFLFILFFYLNNILLIKGVSLEQTLSICCSHGEDWAINNKNCSEYNVPVNFISIELQGLCLSTVDICCSRQYRLIQCKNGMFAAKNGDNCYYNNNNIKNGLIEYGIEYYKDCCEACKIGLVMGSTVDKCSLEPFIFGPPWDDAYESCCHELKDTDEFILSEGDEKDLCNRFENLCSQNCENTDVSYICSCFPGYILLEDKITCVLDTTKLIDIGNDLTSTCRPGYKKLNSTSNHCIDIDECDLGTAKCNIDTQICYNTDGSYTCMDIYKETTGQQTCDPGYRYNLKTEECVDINECLEQLHKCNKDTQLCLNTRGSYSCTNKTRETCVSGFTYDPLRRSCQDINECLDIKCERGYKCINLPGSYECSPIGNKPLSFKPQSSPSQPTKKHPSCAPGFKRHLDKCIDIDECSTDRNACDSNQICKNEPGYFVCTCKIGFVLDHVTNACVDINECQINNHDCLESQRCDNTIGSYTCIRLQSCGTGYTLNAETGSCDDDNECLLNTHTCGPMYECRNTKGSFRCDKRPPSTTTSTTTTTTTTPPPPPPPPPTTPIVRLQRIYSSTSRATTTEIPYNPYQHQHHHQQQQHHQDPIDYNRYAGPCNIGFERNSLGACTDINECDAGYPCRRNQRCINTNGSYRCQNLLNCSGGFTSNEDGTQCIDIDECETKEAACEPDQECRNKPGGYVCHCPPGHIQNAQKRCEDINECEFYKDQVCPGNSECMNTIGSYRCECKNGFRKSPDNDKVCNDIDECSEISGLCSQRCINYWGSYRCGCDTGYRLNDDNNRTCEDINECEIHKTYNLCMGICDNVPGSYVCTCPSGYRLGTDGRTCQDIDECETMNVCRGRNEICTNIRGSYRCKQIDCLQGYHIDPEKRNRCIRTIRACESDDIECFRTPTSYSYNFITLISNMSVPPIGRALFNLKGYNWYENIDFDFKIIHVHAPNNVQKANTHFFSLNKMHNEVMLSLMRSIEGPQDIEVELSMTVFQDGRPRGANVAKIFLIVSEFTY